MNPIIKRDIVIGMILVGVISSIIGFYCGFRIATDKYKHQAVKHHAAHYEHTPDKNSGKFVWNNEVTKKETK